MGGEAGRGAAGEEGGEVNRKIKFKCPECGLSLRPVEGMMSATQVVRRKCKCGAVWQVVVSPHKIQSGWADVGSFFEIPSENRLRS